MNLIKIYTEDNKYSKENNNFDFKLIIFHDFYNRTDMPQKAKVKAYPIILRGLTLNYHYTNLKNITLTLLFNQIYNTTRNYFKGIEYKYGILGR